MSDSDSGPLGGRAALVTGGGSGIGLACARAFARDGADVLLMGRSAARLDEGADAVREVAAPGVAVMTATGDVANGDDVEGAVARLVEACGGVDIAVANAGTGGLSDLTRTDQAEWERVLATNLHGAFHTVKFAARAMQARGGGAICAVSSIAGVRTHRWMTSYCVSKAGVDMLVRNAADELGRLGIRVNSVCPGLVDTEIAAGLMGAEEVHADYLECMPLRRTGTVEDVARAVRFLCGPEASWVTGVNLSVDGGHHLRRGPDLDSFARALYGDGILDGANGGEEG